jgi:hypothetical protein
MNLHLEDGELAGLREELLRASRWGQPDWTRIATDLRRPFTTFAVQYRILEGRDKKKANVAAYISARTAADRLDHVCPGLWEHSYTPVEGGMRCDLKVGGLTRPDVGWSNGVKTAMSLKTLYSDAFKRAAVAWGVGRYLYSLPGMVLYVAPGHVRTWDKPGGGPNGQAKTMYFLTEAGEQELRDRYVTWLESDAGKHFGEPLDHGHVEGSADPEDRDIVADEPEAVAPVVVPLEVLAIRERAEKLGHAALADIDGLMQFVAGRSTNIVRGQVKEWSDELDAMEKKAKADA